MNLLSKSSGKLLTVLSVCLVLFTAACGQRETKNTKNVIAYVNEEPIFADELSKSIALKERLEPMFKSGPEDELNQLDVIIEKKLILQAAVEKGLAREDRFVDTIRTFWEQTLIRDFIDSKKEEFQSAVVATDQEVKDYYSRLSRRVTFKVLKSRDRRVIDQAHERITKKGGSLDDKESSVVGPVGYDDITSSVLLKSFDLPLGGVMKAEDLPDYYLVTVINKEVVTLKPLETLRPQIIERVVAMKERQLFENWFKEKRAKAKIDIINR